MTAVATTSITPTAPNYEAEDAETESVSLALSGLQWHIQDPPKVRAVLLKIKGVSAAKSTKTKATVTVDPTKVTNKQLIAAIKSIGFRATVSQNKEKNNPKPKKKKKKKA